MNSVFKKVGKALLVIGGTAVIVAGGLWAAKEFGEEVVSSVEDDAVDVGSDTTVETPAE